MRRHLGALAAVLFLLAAGGAVGWRVYLRLAEDGAPGGGRGAQERPVPVEVAPVERGTIRDVRELSGTLEASSRFVVASKVSGRIVRVAVDLGDRIERDALVAEIEDAEFVQAVAQAEAERAVRDAARAQAQSALDLAQRDLERAETLRARGIASDAEFDEITARHQAQSAALAVAQAQVEQAMAALELARIRLGYTTVRASWTGGEEAGVVGERHQDAGNTVQPGDSIVSVVALHPLTAAVSVTERDYPRLSVGRGATLRADALAGESFPARIERIAPVFREASRQARVELRVENPDQRLKPGMFVRVRIVLAEEDDATIVPLAGLTRRDGRDVVFLLDESGERVRRVDVVLGIVEGERAQLLGAALGGRVVVLGHQLLRDGSPVVVAGDGGSAP